MSIQLSEYMRKPFVVKAVRVTLDNMSDVAKWCGGTVKQSDTSQDGGMEGDVFYIKVDVKRPLDDRQTRAYVGDYVLAAGQSFKVYTDYAFNKSFVPNLPAEQPKPRPQRPNRPKRQPGSRPPRVQGPGPDLSPIQPFSEPVSGIHPNQLALVEVQDKGFPDEPQEMREQQINVTVAQGMTPEEVIQHVGLTPAQVQGIRGIYNR